MIAGVCLLVVLTIAECRINLGFTPSPKQIVDCGDVTDNSTKVGQCAEAADFCESDAGCVEVLEDYFDCLGVGSLLQVAIDQIEELCDAGTVCAISAVTAILVAIAAALN